MSVRRVLALVVAIAFGVMLPTPASALRAREGHPRMRRFAMLPLTGSTVPLNVQLAIWLKRVDELEAITATLSPMSDSPGPRIPTQITKTTSRDAMIVRPLAPLAPFTTYGVMLASQHLDPPLLVGTITTDGELDLHRPVWNGATVVSTHIRPRSPGVVADRATIAETIFGIWCAEEPWSPTQTPAMLLWGLEPASFDGTPPPCDRSHGSYRIAPIDVAGNVGRVELVNLPAMQPPMVGILPVDDVGWWSIVAGALALGLASLVAAIAVRRRRRRTVVLVAISYFAALALDATPARAVPVNLPPQMLPPDGSVVPLNLQLVIWPNQSTRTRTFRVILVRVATDEVMETTTSATPRGDAALVRPRAPLEPFGVYDVLLAAPNRAPIHLGQLFAGNDADATPPIWNGLSTAGYEESRHDGVVYPRWPAVVADRAILRDTVFGVWCGDRPWDPAAPPVDLLRALFGRVGGYEACGGKWTPFWIAPIDAAGNVGRPAFLPASDLDEESLDRRLTTPEALRDIAAFVQQPVPFPHHHEPHKRTLDVMPPPSLLGTAPRRAIAAVLAIVLLLVVWRAVRPRTTTA
jgi:hypothetical protein